MSLINWLFDFYQQKRIEDLRQEATQARMEAISASRNAGGGVDAQRMEKILGEMALVLKALERTLVDKGVCTHDEFIATVRRLDLEDGRQDGRAPLPG